MSVKLHRVSRLLVSQSFMSLQLPASLHPCQIHVMWHDANWHVADSAVCWCIFTARQFVVCHRRAKPLSAASAPTTGMDRMWAWVKKRSHQDCGEQRPESRPATEILLAPRGCLNMELHLPFFNHSGRYWSLIDYQIMASAFSVILVPSTRRENPTG